MPISERQTKVACKIRLIFVISTSNNLFVQNFSEFHEVPYRGLPYRNPTKTELRYKMNTIFVFNTSNSFLHRISTKKNFENFRAPNME
ncbi:hypothetical protein Y032_0766g2172 [Ancylostoma ceylanicum]|uniref:Uncharacterized protein n=1 Tax=Ancylostoma ceylanicum TaxID=53326 RepID=A0A016WDR7_9BILA|nr:hypothetical protein Y032_0766g2172 [Ancylostoma ceylanicum]